MKLYKKYVLLTLLLAFTSFLFAGLPHNVYVEVYIDSPNNHPQAVTFSAWILGREDEELTETSGGCGYIQDEGLLFVQVGSFPTQWSSGEILHIEVQGDTGDHNYGEFLLSNNGGDFFGPSHFGNDGIDIYIAPIKDEFNADKLLTTVNSKINFTAPQMENVIKWSWDFDNDGKVDSTDKNPIYEYKKSGNYTVKLTIKYQDGKTSTLIKKHYITITE